MTHQLDGQVALITGGGSGIGLGIAQALLEAGAQVVITGRDADKLERAIASLGVRERTHAVTGDVARPDDAARMVDGTITAFGRLDIVVNNAGIALGGPLEEMTAERIDAVIDIDLKGPMHVTRAALPHLRARRDDGGASVVNISSSVTQHPLPNYSLYSAAKAGLDMLTRCWARDWASDRIRVNALCPGVVRTPIFETVMPAAGVDRFLRELAQQTPLGRVGEPADIARLIRFLVGPEGDWVTGAVIPIDGGLSLG